ncbi:carbohydrate porin [Limnohabitans sp.]|uniref:carbohydrate porin n=1 Tax=Limnohabitans sp. TaxID=1907725 RepID=UPI00286EF75B|nr:carbohydrate porin [Limnohabitans sp.]
MSFSSSPSQILGFLLALFACTGWAQTTETEDESARYQITYNTQRHLAFNAPYSSPNSISSQAERMYTLSATAHWGFRPWQGGELYFNPEITQGLPFTGNLVGLGGFTNGEITRAGGTDPKLYRQRLFVRQTWNQGGGQEVVESDFNQMAGLVDKNRWVLTVGNFSTLDVFDDNTYAKDPRTQLMNWGNWTYAAYDYAADARGFGWGFAAEWYQDDWVLRFGRMTGPTSPNAQPTDFALARHYGDQVELERSHQLLNQPGKLRVLAWRNRAQLASFNDATQWLQRPGTPVQTGPDALIAVRNGEKVKYGLGFNVEQAINADVGFFLRAMKADGHTETHAFTEVDSSLSTGLVFKGGLWGRADDAVGVAFMRNTLSADRQQFLKAGGISYFIGDGQLNYRPEQILETFYSFQVARGTWLTADFQHIQNPAYNADRGPIQVYAARFHAEF